jgi:hypothetical protein
MGCRTGLNIRKVQQQLRTAPPLVHLRVVPPIIIRLRTFVVGYLALALALTSGCAGNRVNKEGRTEFLCSSGAVLSVIRQGDAAHVHYEGSVYRLSHKQFALGERYTSPLATLIIDEEYAVLVTAASGEPQDCYLKDQVQIHQASPRIWNGTLMQLAFPHSRL